MTEQNKQLPQEGKTVQPPLWIDNLDLNNLPDRLDDETLSKVGEIARRSLPPMTPCGDNHFKQAMRVMLAVLPKRDQDDISGELFVAAYRKKLANLSDEQISYLADKSMEKCKWFPTIAECLEIAASFKRNDDPKKAKSLANKLYGREQEARRMDQKWRDYKESILSHSWSLRFDFTRFSEMPNWLRDMAVEYGLANVEPDGTLSRNESWGSFENQKHPHNKPDPSGEIRF